MHLEIKINYLLETLLDLGPSIEWSCEIFWPKNIWIKVACFLILLLWDLLSNSYCLLTLVRLLLLHPLLPSNLLSEWNFWCMLSFLATLHGGPHFPSLYVSNQCQSIAGFFGDDNLNVASMIRWLLTSNWKFQNKGFRQFKTTEWNVWRAFWHLKLEVPKQGFPAVQDYKMLCLKSILTPQVGSSKTRVSSNSRLQNGMSEEHSDITSPSRRLKKRFRINENT